MGHVLGTAQCGGDLPDRAVFLDVQLDQVCPRWRRPGRRPSPLHFQPCRSDDFPIRILLGIIISPHIGQAIKVNPAESMVIIDR
jgi:hypothetical protein